MAKPIPFPKCLHIFTVTHMEDITVMIAATMTSIGKIRLSGLLFMRFVKIVIKK